MVPVKCDVLFLKMTQKQDILFKELNGWRGTIGAGKGSHGMCVSGDIMDRLPGYLPVPYAQSHGTEKAWARSNASGAGWVYGGVSNVSQNAS